MSKRFDTAKWKKETYRKLLHPGGHLPRFEHKPPPLIYGRVDDDTDTADLEVAVDVEIDTE